MEMKYELIGLLDLLLQYSSEELHGNDKRIGWEWVPPSQTFASLTSEWRKLQPAQFDAKA